MMATTQPPVPDAAAPAGGGDTPGVRSLTEAAGRRPLARWGLVFLALTAYGLFSAHQTYLYEKLTGGESDYGQLILLGLSSAWTWAALTPGIVWLARRFR